MSTFIVNVLYFYYFDDHLQTTSINLYFTSIVNINACGSLACDGRNKVNVIDIDGSFFGGSVIPDSAADWAPIPGQVTNHVNPVFGLGYNRVPNTLKTTLDGTMLEEEELINDRGGNFY